MKTRRSEETRNKEAEIGISEARFRAPKGSHPKRLSLTGFTLAELLIVIVILGILGGIALPRFFPQTEKARAAEAIRILSAIREAEEAYRLDHDGDYLEIGSEDTDAGTNALWEKLGMENPNLDSKFFDFFAFFDETGSYYQAVRNDTNDGGNNQGKIIQLNPDGTYDCHEDRYPYTPTC